MNDFVEGKCTLPYIYLYNALNSSEKQRLANAHAELIDVSESMWIKQKMSEHGSIEKSFMLASRLSNEAMEVVKDDEELVYILQTMIKRSY